MHRILVDVARFVTCALTVGHDLDHGSVVSLQLTPMEVMKLKMRKALDSQLQKDKTAIAKKTSKQERMAELDRK